jgi:hypothetical protein
MGGLTAQTEENYEKPQASVISVYETNFMHQSMVIIHTTPYNMTRGIRNINTLSWGSPPTDHDVNQVPLEHVGSKMTTGNMSK